MESLQMLILAYAPAIGTLLTILVIALKICRKFAELIASVKDDKTVNALLADNKKLAKLYEDAVSDLKNLKEQVKILRESCAQVTKDHDTNIKELLSQLFDLKDSLEDLVSENKGLQKQLTYMASCNDESTEG